MLELLTTIATRFRREMRSRREMREILERNDEHILKDVGMTRADFQAALSKPIDLGLRHEMERLARQALYLDGARFGARR